HRAGAPAVRGQGRPRLGRAHPLLRASRHGLTLGAADSSALARSPGCQATTDAETGRGRAVATIPGHSIGRTAGWGEKEMRVPLRVATIVTACALLLGAIFAGNIATASPNQFLDKANGHPTFENGKSIAHPSSGTEVSFDDERALGADIQSGASSDAPPDATASAL